MNLVVFGLSMTSGWGNGHAAVYRELLRGWTRCGHEALFLERTQPWYGKRRDLPRGGRVPVPRGAPGSSSRDSRVTARNGDPALERCPLVDSTADPSVHEFAVPGFCRVGEYRDLRDLKRWVREVACADCVLVGSHVPDGSVVGRWVQEVASGVTAFYDLDAWETVARLERGDGQYVSAEELPGYDLYLSTTGGALLGHMEERHGVRRACPLYPAVDCTRFFRAISAVSSDSSDCAHPADDEAGMRWRAGTYGAYCPGRQRQLEGWLLEAARQWPEQRFVVGGGGYPAGTVWPGNVERVPELGWDQAPEFFGGMSWYFHAMRPEQRLWGGAVGLGMLEAAACGVPTITEPWEGMERFFAPGSEIQVVRSGQEFQRVLKETSPEALREMGGRARNRVRAEHSVGRRVLELESLIVNAAEGWRGESVAGRNGRAALFGPMAGAVERPSGAW